MGSAPRWAELAELTRHRILAFLRQPEGVFWVFAGICAVGFVIMQAKLPETKGKTLEQIERELLD